MRIITLSSPLTPLRYTLALNHHPLPPPPQKKNQICQNSLTRELKIRVVRFVLKKLLAYFEMLIVPHALHCVDSCIFVFYLIWHSLAYCFGFSAPPPPPHTNNNKIVRIRFFVKFTY